MLTDFGKYSRKTFLKTLGLLGIGLFGGYSLKSIFKNRSNYSFSSKISGANFLRGHLLRDKIENVPEKVQEIETIIIGGGISGLSAGWWLKKNGYSKFRLLEMDTDVGGNSRGLSNSISKYPLGAHYVPLPSENAKYVRMLFEELGVIKRYQDGIPEYDDFYLCADPHERVYFQGHWHEGLLPQVGIENFHREQYESFFNFIDICKNKRGNDGKYLFSIPLDLSSQDPEFLVLDKISMADFMKSKNWTSEYLNWYVDYCCRDDYGMSKENVSAWAGLHYFASRVGTGVSADSTNVITWPEGNGWLSNKLKEMLSINIYENSLVYKISSNEEFGGYSVDCHNFTENTKVRYNTKNIIYAIPRYLGKRIFSNIEIDYPRNLDYSPWLIANISLSERPSGRGSSLAWDNVSYYSDSLGYIFANHQDLTIHRKECVITYYLPLDKGDINENRKNAYKNTKEDWIEIVVPDLEKMHKGITKYILDIDFWIWGHGMVSPGIGYIWGEDRKLMLKPKNNIYFAHTDMSGISIFEEAQYRGVQAAEFILKKQ